MIPKHFKCLDPKITRKLLEGQEDLLSKEVKLRDSYYKNCCCPNCNSNQFKPLLNPHDKNLIPYYHLHCQLCDCVFDPKTNIVVKAKLMTSVPL